MRHYSFLNIDFMKKAKFTAIIGMAVMMSIPVASLAGNEKQVEIVNENIRYCETYLSV